MSSTPNRPRAERPSAEDKFQAIKKEVAQRNRAVQEQARKLRDADRAAAQEKRRRLDMS